VPGGIRHNTMLELNEFLVLDYIRDHTETSRTDISRDLGLSAASVSRIVARLIRAQVVAEAPDSRNVPGRPPGRILFNGRAGAVMAIDLGGTKCHGALADVSGAIVAEDLRPTRSSGTPFETLLDVIGVLHREAERRALPMAALVIGVPAIVDPETGTASEGPNVAWNQFALVEHLRERLSVPFVVENDVKLAALAQAWRGAGRGVSDFATISIGTGIGAAFVANGELVRGRHNAAGEIGNLVLTRDQLREPRTGGLGGFESVASGPAIAQRGEQLLAARGPDTSRLIPGAVTSEHVFEAALQGDPVAQELLEELLDHVALAIISVAAGFDPAMVILDGGVGRSLEPYLGRLADRIGTHVPWVPELRVSNLGPNATVVGAIATALRLVRQRSASVAVLETLNVGTVAAHG
jgi:glucokinase